MHLQSSGARELEDSETAPRLSHISRESQPRERGLRYVDRRLSPQRTILLVDDSPIVRAVVVHALSAANLSVSTIDDPRGMDEAIAAARPDLLLVDATFPNVTDDDLVTLVSRHVGSFPVILFSDRPDAEVRDLVARCGARGSVPKEGAGLAERLAAFLP
jgi:DNA-binding NarL/FixJ family response regulator